MDDKKAAVPCLLLRGPPRVDAVAVSDPSSVHSRDDGPGRIVRVPCHATHVYAAAAAAVSGTFAARAPVVLTFHVGAGQKKAVRKLN